ncbi:MAG: hypothetical protein JW755_08005, partial [Candidatus Aminicenantes bacterium]|nr:hypothetical protein [Candidatus Aminicenantes bacterium]
VDDLKEQFDLQVEVGKKFTQSHDLIKNVRAIRDQVKDISSRASEAGYPETIKTEADELTKKLTKLEDDLIQVKSESSQDPINYQVKLDNQIAYVYSTLHSQDSKPIRSINERFEELSKKLDVALHTFKDLTETDIKAFEALLEENNIPRIIYDKKKE